MFPGRPSAITSTTASHDFGHRNTTGLGAGDARGSVSPTRPAIPTSSHPMGPHDWAHEATSNTDTPCALAERGLRGRPGPPQRSRTGAGPDTGTSPAHGRRVPATDRQRSVKSCNGGCSERDRPESTGCAPRQFDGPLVYSTHKLALRNRRLASLPWGVRGVEANIFGSEEGGSDD